MLLVAAEALALFQLVGIAYYLHSGASVFCNDVHIWMAFGSGPEFALLTVVFGISMLISAALASFRAIGGLALLLFAIMFFWQINHAAVKMVYPELSCPCCSY